MRASFENLKIGKKLFLSFSVIIVLYIITVVVSVFSIRGMADNMKKLYEEPFANVEASLQVYGKIQEVSRGMLTLATDDSITEFDSEIKKIQENIALVEQGVDELNTGYVSGAESVDKFMDEFKKMIPKRSEVLAKLEEGNKKAALKSFFDSYEPQAKIVRNLAAEIGNLSQADAQDRLNENSRDNTRTLILMFLLAVICLIFSVILGYLITKSIVIPVREVKKAANDIANGQLKPEITYHSDNELGELADDIRETSRVLNSYVTETKRCRTDFADIQNKKECGGNRQWQNHYLRNWAANTKGKGII